ncbi:MAG: Flp family type IVb pilin [Deltaproteobacteria bacterium HGW-Deltaproteobacteria-4]|nr:MAG: Flp family type IVb pilin [Deltaproteobacteria bacterium HGW-Deltaproteobacteria-4]
MKTTAWKQIKNFLKDEEGATAVEYGLMVAAIAAVIILAVFTLGDKVKTTFEGVNTKIDSKGQ